MSVIETYLNCYLDCKESSMDKAWYDKFYLLISTCCRLMV